MQNNKYFDIILCVFWTLHLNTAVSVPRLWNSLPVELKTTQIPLETFKTKLKIYLFTITYDQRSSWNISKFLMLPVFHFARAVQSSPIMGFQ